MLRIFPSWKFQLHLRTKRMLSQLKSGRFELNEHHQRTILIQGLFKEARTIKEQSTGNVIGALANFGACAERDIYLDTENFKLDSMKDRPHEGCVLAFLERIYECAPIANDHPFCNEEHPSYNAISCAIKLNQCLLDSLSGIWDDC